MPFPPPCRQAGRPSQGCSCCRRAAGSSDWPGRATCTGAAAGHRAGPRPGSGGWLGAGGRSNCWLAHARQRSPPSQMNPADAHMSFRRGRVTAVQQQSWAHKVHLSRTISIHCTSGCRPAKTQAHASALRLALLLLLRLPACRGWSRIRRLLGAGAIGAATLRTHLAFECCHKQLGVCLAAAASTACPALASAAVLLLLPGHCLRLASGPRLLTPLAAPLRNLGRHVGRRVPAAPRGGEGTGKLCTKANPQMLWWSAAVQHFTKVPPQPPHL